MIINEEQEKIEKDKEKFIVKSKKKIFENDWNDFGSFIELQNGFVKQFEKKTETERFVRPCSPNV